MVHLDPGQASSRASLTKQELLTYNCRQSSYEYIACTLACFRHILTKYVSEDDETLFSIVSYPLGLAS